MAETTLAALVVDDEEFFREAIRDALAEVGIACEAAGSAAEGAVAAENPRVGAVVPVVVTDDAEEARQAAQQEFAVYETLPRYKRMLALGDGERAADVCLIGDEARVRAGLRRFADAGLTDFLAAPLAVAGSSWERTAGCLAALREET